MGEIVYLVTMVSRSGVNFRICIFLLITFETLNFISSAYNADLPAYELRLRLLKNSK